MKKIISLLSFGIILLFMFSCGKNEESVSYKDGHYNGESNLDEWGGCVKTEITIKDGKITDVILHNLTADGQEKDENYGKQDGEIKNEGLYKIAQNAVNFSQEYPKKLIETQNIEKVDTIAGATVTLKSFKEAVNEALKDAKK